MIYCYSTVNKPLQVVSQYTKLTAIKPDYGLTIYELSIPELKFYNNLFPVKILVFAKFKSMVKIK